VTLAGFRFVHVTVDLDDEPRSQADKINDVRPDR
jgi:hypothetical protein